MTDVDILVLDIEGTTTPIDFVYQVLFPYARVRMARFLGVNFAADDRAQLLSEHEAETSAAKPRWTDPPVDYLLWLMDQDRKSRGVKSIQGKIWEEGYRDGSLRGVVFPDVVPVMRHWKAVGKRIFIYSSGSVHAQRLLFAYSIEGDLTPLIDGFFDTAVGPKREVSSYRAIAEQIEASPDRCLFISDVAAECTAAQDAGFNVLMCVRPGNTPQKGAFPTIRRFDAIYDHVVAISQ